ncbi:hypothetical protein ETB97_007070 [Aspergillus alliaceus]|uniref:Sedlin n=1 Tax=Petromyces alliaceus TaxID=209559 RepID=A0A8H5ZZH1_PETAA|nr:hypothetical protein ETB97_007070 [Aspergillus burnettii]
MSGPKIACIGIIGKADNPLHISLFPPYLNSKIEFSFLLNSCLDIFEIRQKQTSVDQDLGLLHAVDERLAAYGWLTTTGVKLLVILDLIGHPAPNGIEKQRGSVRSGSKDPDLKPVRPDSMPRVTYVEYTRVVISSMANACVDSGLPGIPGPTGGLYSTLTESVLFSR